MKNNEILNPLSKFKELKSFRLPSSIDFSLEKKCLTVTLSSVTGNMQEDKSAFEGWIICFKSWMPSITEKVILDWNPPKDDVNSLHYNRFLFRVVQFQKMYSWFSVSNKNAATVEKFSRSMLQDKWINYPLKGKLNSVSENKKEDKIESLFVNEYQNLLKGKLNLETINQQLPVGIFNESVKSGNYFFSGQKSAIDLWGLSGEELSIFELKYKNKKVGIISELLFYLYLMNYVFIAGEIQYPEKAERAKVRDFDKLYSKKLKKLKGYFLIDKLHPFISDGSIMLITEGLKKIGDISVEKLVYEYDEDNQKLSWK